MTTAAQRQARRDRGHFGSQYLKTRAEIFQREQLCYLCGEWVNQDLHWKDPGAPQLHLVVPRALGGSWRDPKNMHLTHRQCNMRQGDNWDGTVDHRRTEEDPAWVVDETP